MTGPRMKVLDVAILARSVPGISVARRIREAQITAQDWPNVLEIAQRNANSAGVGDRYHPLPGDIFEVDLDGEYDVILVANLLHHFDPPACIRLLEKLHQSLAEEGRLIVLEFVPDEDRVTPSIPASFALMLLGVTPAGDVYSARQLHEFLSAARFNKPVLVPVPQSPQCLVISEEAAPSGQPQLSSRKIRRKTVHSSRKRSGAKEELAAGSKKFARRGKIQ